MLAIQSRHVARSRPHDPSSVCYSTSFGAASPRQTPAPPREERGQAAATPPSPPSPPRSPNACAAGMNLVMIAVYIPSPPPPITRPSPVPRGHGPTPTAKEVVVAAATRASRGERAGTCRRAPRNCRGAGSGDENSRWVLLLPRNAWGFRS